MVAHTSLSKILIFPFFRDVIVVKGVNYGDFVFFGVKMGILWAKVCIGRHFVGIVLAVYSLF